MSDLIKQTLLIIVLGVSVFTFSYGFISLVRGELLFWDAVISLTVVLTNLLFWTIIFIGWMKSEDTKRIKR